MKHAASQKRVHVKKIGTMTYASVPSRASTSSSAGAAALAAAAGAAEEAAAGAAAETM